MRPQIGVKYLFLRLLLQRTPAVLPGPAGEQRCCNAAQKLPAIMPSETKPFVRDIHSDTKIDLPIRQHCKDEEGAAEEECNVTEDREIVEGPNG